MLFLNTIHFYETIGSRLDSKWCQLAVCVQFELMLAHEITERCNDNEQWIETGKGCGSDENWPSLRYSADHNIMPTIGTVTVQD
jgi:hypothetical protein